MNNRDFDKCPRCGAEPTLGLRCHPKYSVKVGIIYGPDRADLVAFYAHDEFSLRAMKAALETNPSFTVMEMEYWDAGYQKWMELK